jgi:hypothetical protein
MIMRRAHATLSHARAALARQSFRVRGACARHETARAPRRRATKGRAERRHWPKVFKLANLRIFANWPLMLDESFPA